MENNVEKTSEELMKEFFDSNDLKNLDKESLGHWNNIMSSIAELRKLNKENSSNHSMGLWLMLMMMALPTNVLSNLPTDETV